ncbi:unnamed protein product [Sphagnum jensenii]|uniref:FAD/NAD(P)-binding domain-containing protein n=1 Tax=Sphagnum jensenii TaxID=128206 RepID=A0ABP0VBZ7_9BRYO
MKLRETQFDVVIAAGPRLELWPSIGVRTLSELCSEVGLQVGAYGGRSISVRGIVPYSDTGTGNRALHFASTLLVAGVPEVYLVETHTQWGGKRFSGWEVERRQVEMLGGRLIEGKPLELRSKGPGTWQFRLADSRGVRVIDVSRVVSAGPFQKKKPYERASIRFILIRIGTDLKVLSTRQHGRLESREGSSHLSLQ